MRLAATTKQIHATLAKAATLERAEYKLQWRDLMNRGKYTEARELTGKMFMRGTLTAAEGLADVEAVKIALELNERELRN